MLGRSVLETERLTLRPHERGDFADSLLLWTDPIVTRFIGGRAFSREEVWARLLRYIGHWSVMGFGFWVIHEKATGRFVGEVGFAEFMREVTPSLEGTPEMGWALMPEAHGKGFASEAVAAALSWLDRSRGPGRTVCMIDPANGASLRVAAKCGYEEWTRTLYKEQPVILFQRGA
jgi:RimJ/RimL family protein N-acetyltransferase